MDTGAIATIISNCERKRSLFDPEKLECVADDCGSAHRGTRMRKHTSVAQGQLETCHQVLQRHTDRWLYSALVAGKRIA